MAKESGLGDALYLAGHNVSVDIQQLGKVGGGPAALDMTGIDKLGMERRGGIRDGGIDYTGWFNPGPEANALHQVAGDLPTADVVATYCRGTTLGNPAACLVAKQANYDPKRANDGALTFEVSLQANGYGLEWGRLLTAGIEPCTNRLTGQNAGFEGGIGTWATAGAAATVAASSAQARTGTGSLAITSTSTTDAAADHHDTDTSGFPVTPGRAYTFQAWYRAATVARTVQTAIRWYDSGGVTVSGTAFGNSATDSTSGWTISRGVGVAPATAAYAVVRTTIASPGGAGEVHYVDDVSFFANPAAVDFGTGSTTFGLQAYLHVTAFTGTDATIALYESSDDAATDAYTAVTGGAFTTVTGIGAQRIQTARDLTVERYLRPRVSTTAGFDVLNYSLVVVRNDTATEF